MRIPRWISTTTVRIECGGGPDEPMDRFRPGIRSRHDELLHQMDSIGGETWAVLTLRCVLRRVRDGNLIEPIAVIDAWPENDDTFYIVYTPPWGPDPLVGIRRMRGDLDPVAQLGPASTIQDLGDFEMPADPGEYAELVVDDISEPLGNTHLHRASNGFGWWGTLDNWPPLAWTMR